MPTPLDLGLPTCIGHNYIRIACNSTFTIIAVEL